MKKLMITTMLASLAIATPVLAGSPEESPRDGTSLENSTDLDRPLKIHKRNHLPRTQALPIEAIKPSMPTKVDSGFLPGASLPEDIAIIKPKSEIEKSSDVITLDNGQKWTTTPDDNIAEIKSEKDDKDDFDAITAPAEKNVPAVDGIKYDNSNPDGDDTIIDAIKAWEKKTPSETGLVPGMEHPDTKVEVNYPLPVWTAQRDLYLSQVLGEWSEAAGWQLNWNTEYDYVIQAGAQFQGNYVEAAGAIIEAFRDAKPPLRAHFYKGNNTLVIETSTEYDID